MNRVKPTTPHSVRYPPPLPPLVSESWCYPTVFQLFSNSQPHLSNTFLQTPINTSSVLTLNTSLLPSSSSCSVIKWPPPSPLFFPPLHFPADSPYLTFDLWWAEIGETVHTLSLLKQQISSQLAQQPQVISHSVHVGVLVVLFFVLFFSVLMWIQMRLLGKLSSH